MNEWISRPRCQVCLLAIAAIVFLAACERPDPDPVSAAPPVLMPTVAAMPEPTSTPIPIQVYVTVLMPTSAAAAQPIPESVQVVIVSPTPEATEVTQFVPTEIAPTPYPTNFYMGWVWSEGLAQKDNNRTFVDWNGAQLWDRPSPEGEKIGLVVGLAEVIVAGRSYCGYTPVLAHQGNLLSMITPPPEVFQPVPSTAQQETLPLFAIQEGTTSGWVYMEAVDVMDDSAVAGQFGLTLRQEPCQYAANLGFIPAYAVMEITAPPSGEYIPVRVSNELMQYHGPVERKIQFEPAAGMNRPIIQPTPTPYFP